MKTTTKKSAIACAIVLLLVSLIYWAQNDEDSPKLLQDGNGDPKLPMPFHSAGPGTTVLTISAQDLLTEFQQDEDVARKKYDGMTVWVNGTVTEISGPTVTLEAPPGIHCVYMSVKEQARLGIGRKATIEGFLHGHKDQITLFRPWKKKV